MKALITPLLINYLQAEGYKYCLAKKHIAAAESPNQCLILLPLRKKPVAGSLPDRYYTLLKMDDDWATLTADPIILADDPDGDTLVMMELTSVELGGYLNFLFNAQAKSA
jgi:hypothetical protein